MAAGTAKVSLFCLADSLPVGRGGLRAQPQRLWLGNGREFCPPKVKGRGTLGSGCSRLGFVLFLLKYLKSNATTEINFLPKTALQSIRIHIYLKYVHIRAVMFFLSISTHLFI